MGDALIAGFEFLLLASVYCLVTLPRARRVRTSRGAEQSYGPAGGIGTDV